MIKDKIKRVSAKKLCTLYQSEVQESLNRELLFDIASQLDVIAQTVPTFDQEDHDWGKDAGHFHWAYLDACAGKKPTFISYDSVEAYLMQAIDTLLSGCHTDASVADYYIEGGVQLLDAIFEWNGEGDLYNYFKTK